VLGGCTVRRWRWYKSKRLHRSWTLEEGNTVGEVQKVLTEGTASDMVGTEITVPA